MSQAKRELVRSTNVFADIWHYLFRRPPVGTLIRYRDSETKKNFVDSIMQRTGIDVNNYKLLNIHQVGVEAPASHVFDELMQWSGDAICWPNHIARVELQDNSLQNIKIYLFGINRKIFGWQLFHLFDLSILKMQPVPSVKDADNARYLLYECKGGYPIGVFSMFVRSSIPERGEKSMSQLFMMVSFNFFGKNHGMNLIRRIWEPIHNRVTANVIYRIKQLCEYKFESLMRE